MDICKTPDESREMNIVIVGHVDHGKSTVIGRLLADTGSLPEGKLEMIQELCRRNSKPFEYAFLLDALKDERSQGITIDTARCFFKTEKRKYIIIDAPGHIEFLKNMITGASRAEAALLVIDAHEGIRENSRRHSYMLSMLGIKQVVVLINKLDLVLERDRQRYYEDISKEFSEFLGKIGLTPACFIPISATEGYNVAKKSVTMPWYTGETVLEALDKFRELPSQDNLPFRMWCQDIYKFTNQGDERRIVAGTVSSGTLCVGDEVTFYPSGKKTTVSSIEAFNEPQKSSVVSGFATGFCMSEQIYAKRGELIAKSGQPSPLTGSAVTASIFWLGKEPLTAGKTYKLKIGSAQTGCRLERILGVLNASTLEGIQRSSVERHEVARCILTFERPIAFDISGSTNDTSRFVIVDGYEISGGGIITGTASGNDRLSDSGNIIAESSVPRRDREILNSHKSCLALVSSGNIKSPAALLENELVGRGINAYSVSLREGVAGDESIKRLCGICSVLLDAGEVVIVDTAELSAADIDLLKLAASDFTIITMRISDNALNKVGDEIIVDSVSSAAKLIEVSIALK